VTDRTAATTSPGSSPIATGSEPPLVAVHDVALLDLDGVLYVGPEAVPGAPEAVRAVREAGMGVAFVTNNAARTPETVAAHLSDLGVPARPEQVVTSAQAVARLVAEQVPPGSPVLVVGGDGLDAAVGACGLRPVRRADDSPAAVVQGFSPDVGWPLLAEGTYAVDAGVPWFASNLDTTLPTPQGRAPGNGALVGVIATATGRRPVAAGKPETPLHEEAVRRTGASDPLVVGDRLDTDIDGANRAGAPSLLVLTGVSTPADLVHAGRALRPTYVSTDLRAGLLEPHPPVRRLEDGRWQCAGWTCGVGADGLELIGNGDAVDGLRALCVARWAFPGPVQDQVVRAALARLGW
jgi:HAD superfamily hydrolase (TIGR01450 family)